MRDWRERAPAAVPQCFLTTRANIKAAMRNRLYDRKKIVAAMLKFTKDRLLDLLRMLALEVIRGLPREYVHEPQLAFAGMARTTEVRGNDA